MGSPFVPLPGLGFPALPGGGNSAIGAAQDAASAAMGQRKKKKPATDEPAQASPFTIEPLPSQAGRYMPPMPMEALPPTGNHVALGQLLQSLHSLYTGGTY